MLGFHIFFRHWKFYILLQKRICQIGIAKVGEIFKSYWLKKICRSCWFPLLWVFNECRWDSHVRCLVQLLKSSSPKLNLLCFSAVAAELARYHREEILVSARKNGFECGIGWHEQAWVEILFRGFPAADTNGEWVHNYMTGVIFPLIIYTSQEVNARSFPPHIIRPHLPFS